TNNLFATFDRIATTTEWQQVFVDQLNRWASVSNRKVEFQSHADDGLDFNYAGAAQNDVHSGDIRIGAHRFDAPGTVLHHPYAPQPTRRPAAGGAHYDSAGAWALPGSGNLSGPGGGGGGGPGNLMTGPDDDAVTLILGPTEQSRPSQSAPASENLTAGL